MSTSKIYRDQIDQELDFVEKVLQNHLPNYNIHRHTHKNDLLFIINNLIVTPNKQSFLLSLLNNINESDYISSIKYGINMIDNPNRQIVMEFLKVKFNKEWKEIENS